VILSAGNALWSCMQSFRRKVIGSVVLLHVLPASLLAASEAAPAHGPTAAVYEFARLRQHEGQPWWYLLIGLGSAAIGAFAWLMIRRDTVQQRKAIRYLLLFLRLTAIAGLVFFFLGLQRRNVYQSVRNSRVLMLIDVSQSMGLQDASGTASDATAAAAPNRIEQVAAGLTEGSLVADLRRTHDVDIFAFDRETRRLVELPKVVPGQAEQTADRPASGGEADAAAAPPQADWRSELTPQGAETRLGDALRKLIHDHRSMPLAGVVAISDGGQNAGVDPEVAIREASADEVPIYTVGIGAQQRPINVRVSDLVAPAKALGGDAFTLTGYLQAEGLAGRTVTVELHVHTGAAGSGDDTLAGTQRIVLGGDGEVVAVAFELHLDRPGRHTYRLEVRAPPEDRSPRDNQQSVDVEIVDHASRVLLLASGASREYRFLRSLLYRDKDVTVDVLLQSSRPGISQDANEILTTLPESTESFYRYDALVAFDPDWAQFDAQQIELLDRWLTEQAAGLIVVAGPIHTATALRDPKLTTIRDLYPIALRHQLSIVADTPVGSEFPVPIELTREGHDARFLWLGETATESAVTWSAFPGVFGCFPARQAKPGATVYAVVADQDVGLGGNPPIMLAEQFYGAGRVFYVGSGEMWRLRALDEGYFETFYTKLIRHVSQGRLLRGSTRGLLLVERDRYLVGDTIIVRAQMTDAQHQPLSAARITAQVTRPDGTLEPLPLAADATREGMFFGQLTARQEGSYRIDLPVPDATDQQLTRRLQVQVPDRERQHPQRNDALLSDIAVRTGGHYYVGLEATEGHSGLPSLAAQLSDRTEVTRLTGAPDRAFEQRLMQWLLIGIVAALCLEWLTRRLCRLA
jgi:hypothetical protein